MDVAGGDPMTAVTGANRFLIRAVPTGEFCLECECEMTMVFGDDGVDLELSCECGSRLALCA